MRQITEKCAMLVFSSFLAKLLLKFMSGVLNTGTFFGRKHATSKINWHSLRGIFSLARWNAIFALCLLGNLFSVSSSRSSPPWAASSSLPPCSEIRNTDREFENGQRHSFPICPRVNNSRVTNSEGLAPKSRILLPLIGASNPARSLFTENEPKLS